MAITPVSAESTASAISSTLSPSSGTEHTFSDVLSSAMQQVNSLQNTAEQKVTSLISGNGEDVHAATLAVERASLAFDLMLQVRNKVVNAYQEISRLQF
jgi:flagellar hook-basal body complex protein FliE